MAQPDLAAAPLRGELEPCKSVNRDRIGFDAAHVADSDTGLVSLQQCADAPAEPGQVGTSDGAGYGEDERLRLRGSHLDKDRAARRNSSLADR